jgi:predicted DNA-binding transcriptional regulator YafY
VVEPHFIVFRGHAFYFVAWCRMRDGFRTFRIERLRGMRRTDDFFLRREIDPKKYFEGSWLMFDGEPIDVVARFRGLAARVVSSAQHHPDERVSEETDGIVRYELTVKGVEEIRRWLLGFGDEVEVLSPPELRRSMAKISRRTARLYADSEAAE